MQTTYTWTYNAGTITFDTPPTFQKAYIKVIFSVTPHHEDNSALEAESFRHYVEQTPEDDIDRDALTIPSTKKWLLR
jgi:hypothetical protein